MNALLVLIPLTLLVIAVALFFRAVNHPQFGNFDSPGVLPLMDDPAPEAEATDPPEPAGEESQEPCEVSPRKTR